ncbi:MAG TPA: helix-turn-helix domain-containing protein [Nocardioidaceae bacterium]|nr:helix-turn-helix domain-containing protein [Nocardioidaceae bacterium]
MSPPRSSRPAPDAAGLGEQASRESGGVPAELLGDYLHILASAAGTERRLTRAERDRFRRLGEQAAESGVGLAALIDLYLSATWRTWRHLPAVGSAVGDQARVHAVGEAVLRAADDTVAAAADGYQHARRQALQREVAQRREFVDDLLSGLADIGGLIERAEQYGLTLTAPHTVTLVIAETAFTDEDRLLTALERRLSAQAVGTEIVDLLVTTKQGLLVCLTGPGPDQRADALTRPLVELLSAEPALRERPWQIGVGRPYPGAAGVLRSYDEARDALDLAARLHLSGPVVHAADLLAYQVLGRDRAALIDLVRAVLGPLQSARGGAQPLLDTMDGYFAAGAVATQTARQMHLSVRAVTYRLDRIKELTGHDPTSPADRFALHAALLGAQLLDWPAQPLPEPA